MQIAVQTLQEERANQPLPAFKIIIPDLLPKMISGARQKFIKWIMWTNIVMVALKKFRNPFIAVQKIKKLQKLRDQYRNQHSAVKYSFVDNKYFVNYNTPAWPSKAFDRYISHLFNRTISHKQTSLNTLVFA